MAVLLLLAGMSTVEGKTRWSSLRMVPDADLLPGGDFVIGFDGMLGKSIDEIDSMVLTADSSWMVVSGADTSFDTAFDTSYVVVDTTDPAMFFTQSYMVKLGVVEWVNFHIGYSGGFTLGFKARLLGETSKAMPSLAIGAHNIFNHKEVNHFKYKTDKEINNEFFVAFGKSAERIKLRLHAGIQSMPTVQREVFNPFFAIEKYFGFGLYTALEAHRRDLSYHFHLFANMRALDDKLEISAGAVALESMFFDENKQLSISLSPRSPHAFVGPGIWFGIRFHSRMGFGGKGGFVSTEEKIQKQDETIESLRGEMDSLRQELATATKAVRDVRETMGAMGDSAETVRIKNRVIAELEMLKALYTADEFDPDSVRSVVSRIRRFGERGVAALKEILTDESLDRHVRQYSVTVLGTIGNRSASDVLLDVLARTGDPDLKIEILIALGKMRETRAMYLMEQLANDPNDAIALTAQEVLRRLSEQTGAKISPDLKMRKIPPQQRQTIPESKIEVKEEQPDDAAHDSTGPERGNTSPQKAAEDKPQRKRAKSSDAGSDAAQPAGE
ncbi:MAG: hypothetical protein GF410_03970 [Chitinivibrionales bacterium]|nr:hypothetical protein [Chitinivibrionales bacterium]